MNLHTTQPAARLRRLALAGLAPLAFVAIMAGPAQSQTPQAPPGVDWSKLDAAQQATFVAIAEEQFCPCGKPQSFWDSLNKPADCPSATRLGRQMASALADGTSKRGVVRALLKSIANLNARFDFDTKASPRLGSEGDAIEIVVFSDFECPYCRSAAAELTRFARKHADVSLIYKCYPIAFHPNARRAALAALAAGRQGKFWEMHDAIYDSDKSPDEKRLEEQAKRLKLDLAQWTKDMADPELAAQVDADKREGDQAGIQGTPTLFVNGLMVVDLDALDRKVNEERASQKR